MADDSRPVPDPTALTTQALEREVAAIREYLDTVMEGEEKLVSEKFARVDQQFELVARQRLELKQDSLAARLEQKQDGQAAVNAALIAQKEAVKEQTIASEKAIDKSESATSKQLEQLSATFNQAIHGVQEAVSDLKDRVGKIEAVKKGGQDTLAGVYALGGFIAVLITIVGFIVANK